MVVEPRHAKLALVHRPGRPCGATVNDQERAELQRIKKHMRGIYWGIALTIVAMFLDSIWPTSTYSTPLAPVLVGAVVVLVILSRRSARLVENAAHRLDAGGGAEAAGVITTATQRSDAQNSTETVRDTAIELQRSTFRRRPLISLGAGLAILFILIGILNGYPHEVVDQDGRWEKRATGEFDIVRTGNCSFGIPGCLDSLIASYNAACLGHTLTPAGLEICQQTENNINEEIAYWENCGVDCEPAPVPVPGDLVWTIRKLGASFLDVVPVTRNFHVPKVTHTERCYFNLGPIQIGSCL